MGSASKPRSLSAVLLVFLMTISLAACSKPKPQPSPTPQPIRFSVGLGPGDSSYVDTCDYQAFEENGNPDLPGGIFRMLPERVPKGSKVTLTPIGPPEGSSLHGNFEGLGKRFIRDERANRWYKVELVYHADSYQAILTKMDQLGCFQ